MSWQPKPKRTSCSLFQDQAEPVELVMVLFSLVNYVSPSGYIPSSRYQNCHFHRFVASLCPVSSQHLPKCLFIAVPHSINCWSSHAKTLLFRDFKKKKPCGWCQYDMWREKGSGLEMNLFQRSKTARVFLHPVSITTFWITKEGLQTFCCLVRVTTVKDCVFISEGNSNNTLCSKKIINCTMDGQVLMCHTLVCLLFACLLILLKPAISAQSQIKITTLIQILLLHL